MTFPNPAPGLADSRISVLGLPGRAGQMPAPPEGGRGPAPAPPRLLSHPGLVSAALALAHQELVLWMLFSGACVCVCVCVCVCWGLGIFTSQKLLVFSLEGVRILGPGEVASGLGSA